jgi:hypothetical protein
MKFVLNIPENGRLEYDTYEDAIFALYQVRGSLDGISMDEIDDSGSVVRHVKSEELHQVIANMDAISPATVLLGKPGRTL